MRRSHAVSILTGLLVAGACLPASAHEPAAAGGRASARVTDVRYEIVFDSSTARSRTVRVAMHFRVSGGAPVLLSLPVWTPGAYEVSDFARWVVAFDAFETAADTAALRWDKADQDTWRVFPRRSGSVTVRLTIVADQLDNAMAWSARDFALINGTAVFPYPEGQSLDFPATLAVSTEPGWRVTTAMTPGGAANEFRASSYHELVDMPLFVGHFDLDSSEVAGRWMRLATYPSGSVTGGTRVHLWNHIRRMLPPQIAVFGELPYERFTILQIVDSTTAGISALEHGSSFVGITTPLAFGDPRLSSIYAHELFHAWNVKRMRPAELWPYRYDRPQPSEWLWVSEGVTDYYADLSLVRGGIVDSSGFFAATAAKIAEVDSLPRVSLEDASLSVWIDPVNGTGKLYYPKGSLAGLMLDILIRDASDNRRSLDDVMRDVYRASYAQGRGFTAAHWWTAVARAAGGRSFDDVRARYVDGREPYPWSTVLPLAALRLTVDTAREPRLGVYVLQDTGGLVISGVPAGGDAEKAGVRVGDLLLSVADIPVTEPGFSDRLRELYRRGDRTTLPLVVRRGQRQLRLTVPVRYTMRVTHTIAPLPDATPKAARILGGILHGRVE
jgi:predicted metalloprotease with PDZ domain